MDKLELKHLTPYLPYELKAFALHYILPKRYLKIIGIVDDIIQPSNPSFEGDYDIPVVCKSLEEDDFDYIGYYPLFDIKPILRPLSDLDKDINHNGEIINIFKKIAIYEGSGVDYLINQIQLGLVEVIVWNLLLEYHFDVFDLVPRGLAIDIKTLK